MGTYVIDARSLAARPDALCELKGLLVIASRTAWELERLARDGAQPPELRAGAQEVLADLTYTGLRLVSGGSVPSVPYWRSEVRPLDEALSLQVIAAGDGAPERRDLPASWALTPEEAEIVRIAEREGATILTCDPAFLNRLRAAGARVSAGELDAELLPPGADLFGELTAEDLYAALRGDPLPDEAFSGEPEDPPKPKAEPHMPAPPPES